MFRKFWRIAAAVLVFSEARADEPITIDRINEILKAREASITSLEIHGREYLIDESGKPRPGTVRSEFEYAWTAGAKREFRNLSTGIDGKVSTSEWAREDGSKRFFISCFEGQIDRINSVRINKTVSTDARNSMPTPAYLHYLTPRGMKLSDLVSTGTILNVSDAPMGQRTVRLKVIDGNYSYEIELSEAHDFLVQAIDFGALPKYRATKFGLIDGFWFPLKAVRKNRSSQDTINIFELEIDSIKVNRKIDPNRFALPKLEDGVLVYDDSGPNTFYVAGAKSKKGQSESQVRNALVAKYDPKSKQRNDIPDTPITATDREPRSSAYSWWIAAISGSLITIAVAVRIFAHST